MSNRLIPSMASIASTEKGKGDTSPMHLNAPNPASAPATMTPWLNPLPLLLSLTLLVISSTTPGLAQQHNARELVPEGASVPNWTIDPEFINDHFAFVRVHYTVDGRYGPGHDPSYRWLTDAPDSDLNFSWRLSQLTSVAVHPDGRFLEIGDPALFDFPFLYIVEPGRLTFQDQELVILRKYLENGGFLMLDDFWGNREWMNFANEMKRLFPTRELTDLPADHPLFSCVFPIKEPPQVPNMDQYVRSEATGIPWQRPDTKEPHYRAIFDDRGRMMVLACHNTDNGDGWEREGENEAYFKENSEKKAYPLGINILFYVMTH